MQKSYALILAWPETYCKRAGGWYDNLMDRMGYSEDGYFQVGHSAMVLIDGTNGDCHYFDFGRYHAPEGFGRVRDASTDYDLEIDTKITFSNFSPVNTNALINELQNNKSCHGDGIIKTGLVEIDFDKGYAKAKKMQENDFLPYGPFIHNGTNCARFVRTVVSKSIKNPIRKLVMYATPLISPTPMWILKASKKCDLRQSALFPQSEEQIPNVLIQEY